AGIGLGGQGIVDSYHLARLIRGLREIAAPLKIGRHGPGRGKAAATTQTFVGHEKERAVLAMIEARQDNRSPQGAPELVEAIRGTRLAGTIDEEIVGCEFIVAEELEQGAMKFVGARLGDHVNYAAGSVRELGAEVVGLHLIFLHRIYRRENAGAVESRFGIRAAVQQKRILIRA